MEQLRYKIDKMDRNIDPFDADYFPVPAYTARSS
jgi:hypothetical protein